MANTGQDTRQSEVPTQPRDGGQLVAQLSQRVQAARTVEEGLQEIAAACSAFDVTIERITLQRDEQTSELTITENTSGVRRNIEGHVANLTITVTCVNSMSPSVNANLQSLVTMAAIAAQQWTNSTTETLEQPEAGRMIPEQALKCAN